MTERPSLAEFKRPVTLAEWFAERTDAAGELERHMRDAGLTNTHRYLRKFFMFPYSLHALNVYAHRVGWVGDAKS